MKDEIVKFAAYLTLKSEADGGRRTPIKNGYRTDLSFKDERRILVIEFNKECFFPNESGEVIASVLLHSKDEIDYLLKVDSSSIIDGPTIIGELNLIREVL
jgi:hypothetical protein